MPPPPVYFQCTKTQRRTPFAGHRLAFLSGYTAFALTGCESRRCAGHRPQTTFITLKSPRLIGPDRNGTREDGSAACTHQPGHFMDVSARRRRAACAHHLRYALPCPRQKVEPVHDERHAPDPCDGQSWPSNAASPSSGPLDAISAASSVRPIRRFGAASSTLTSQPGRTCAITRSAWLSRSKGRAR